MLSARNSEQGNAQRSDEALKFASLFFAKQDSDKVSLCEMYHDHSTLIWNGQTHKSKTSIAKFYQNQTQTKTTLKALDAQIMPQMGDIIDMITVLACGTIEQNNVTSNFSRTFLLGPHTPGSAEYLIVSDNMRVQS